MILNLPQKDRHPYFKTTIYFPKPNDESQLPDVQQPSPEWVSISDAARQLKRDRTYLQLLIKKRGINTRDGVMTVEVPTKEVNLNELSELLKRIPSRQKKQS